MSTNIRWLETFETNHLEQIYCLYKSQWWTQNRSFDDFVIMLENSNLSLACYNDVDELLGFSRVLTDRVFKAIIFDVMVTPDFQGQGIGQKMVRQIENHPELSNVKSFELFCPESISAFYEGLGFKRCETVYLEKSV